MLYWDGQTNSPSQRLLIIPASILDGLDECEIKPLEELIKALAAYFDSTPRALGTSACCFKVIILSRPHNFIQQKLCLQRKDDSEDPFRQPDVEHVNKIRLVAEEETVAIAKDIALFVRSKMVEFRQSSELFPDVLQRLENRLINGVDFTFLWISLVIKLVEDTEVDGISTLQLESILNTTNLDDVYERLLSEKVLPLKTRKALMLVLTAVRPLTVKEMCAAIEIRQDHFPKISNDAQARIRLNKYEFNTASLGRRVKVAESSTANSKVAEVVEGHARDEKVGADKASGQVKHGKMKLDNSDVPMAGSNDATISSLSQLSEVLRKPFSNHLRQICGHFLRIRGRKVYLVHQTAREFLLYRTVNTKPRPFFWKEPEIRATSCHPQEKPSTDGSRDIQAYTGTVSQHGWRHSIRLEDANRYLLRICADYIQLFVFEKIGGKLQWKTKDAVAYLKECRDDPPRAFFKYAAFHWIDHYRPIRKSLDYSYDYLLKPSEQHFKIWIIVHPSWIPEEERHQLEAGGIPIHRDASEPDKEHQKLRLKMGMYYPSLNKADKRAEDLEGVLEHFNLGDVAETELYRDEFLTGDRYWKNDEDGCLKPVDLDDGDGGGDEEGDALEDPETAGVESWKIPDKVQFYWRQNRREALETLEEVCNPFSPTGGNPTSCYSGDTAFYATR
ncbi:hypothetical protein ACHAPT_011126 [Fusarium lateritium]